MTFPMGGKGPAIIGLSWAMWGLAAIMVVLRIYARFTLIKIKSWSLTWVLITVV